MTSTPCSGNRKLILDVDTGIDDALALEYLASFNEVDLLGIIGTYGNVVADTAVRNTDEKTGSIALDSSILFDSGQFALKASGEELLQKFLPKYIGVLTDKQFNDYISEIIIEGHTDTQGDYLYNLELSQKRALSVATFCLDENKKVLSTAKITKLRKIVTANGKSFSNPILDKDGKEDQNASRRVEFLFRLKDDEMINDISDILNN